MDDSPLRLSIVRRAGMKRIVLRVKPNGEIRVSAPPWVEDSRIYAFIHEKKDWIAQQLLAVASSKQEPSFFDRLPMGNPKEVRDVVARMNGLVRPLIGRYADLMGVRVSGVTFKAMRSRWGSCNTRTHKLCFSVYMLLLPDWCAEHIVVHELAHLIVPNHSKAFHDVMDRYFPRWREARAMTRRLCRGEIEA